MFPALDRLFARPRPGASPVDQPRQRAALDRRPSLREPNIFERGSVEQLWSAPAHWRL